VRDAPDDVRLRSTGWRAHGEGRARYAVRDGQFGPLRERAATNSHIAYTPALAAMLITSIGPVSMACSG
jgi:hypothetical protein